MIVDQVFAIECFGESHTGRVRTLNEDRFLISAASGVFAVADGMGGHEAGEVASSTIVEHLGSIGVPSSAPDLRARFEDRLALANRRIRAIAARRGAGLIGSTVAALLAFERQYACVWAGDSRIYRVRNGAIEQLSRDHNEAQQLVDQGVLTQAEARDWPRRNVITRAVGVSDEVELELEHGQILGDDTFVVCSDGLTAHLDDDDVAAAVAGRSAQNACKLMIEAALERGGSDNVTVIVTRFREGTGQL